MSGSIELEKFVDELIKRSIEKGHTPQMFTDMRHRHGTMETIKRLVTSKNVQEGFKKLGELGLLDMSAEAAVLKFPEEFTPEEQEVARWRLKQAKKSFGLRREKIPQTGEDYFNRAFKSYAEGNYDSAVEDYTEGLHLQPNDVYAWLIRGDAWNGKGKYDEAIADYSRVIHLKSNFATAWWRRGEAWYRKNEYDKAIDDLNEALRLSPDSSNAQRIRGDTWRQKGEYGKALADYNEVLRLFPEDEEIKQNLIIVSALQASGSEREEIIENLKSEYGRDLKEQMSKSLGQILKDREGFTSEYKTNKRTSFWLRILAVILLLTIACVWIYLFAKTYNFDMQELQTSGPDIFLRRAPAFTTLTAPFLVLVWLLLRWGYETKTVSYAFQRKAVLEERIFLYFNNDVEKLKDMQELFVAHWMEKSPLEVMLAIGGKRKHGGETPVDALSGKLEELINILKTRAGKGDD